MCGRAACTLDPDQICHACGYKNPKSGEWIQPKWKEPPGGQKYYPSTNVAPGSHIPILVSRHHVESGVTVGVEMMAECEWVVQPMRWGLIPHWHSGDIKNVGYNMINARSDGMLKKPAFKQPLEKGRRCIILVDGYFEWQNNSGKKQPYYIYFPPSSDTVKVKDDSKDVVKQEDKPQGDKRLLTLAGVFNIYTPVNNEPPVYSCSIITVDAHKSIEWIHDRMPAILDGEQEVRQWLDHGSVSLNKAVQLIQPTDKVQYHPVSTDVGNVKNKSEDLTKPIDLKKGKETASSRMMLSWLSKGSTVNKRSAMPDKAEPEVKKVKSENESAE